MAFVFLCKAESYYNKRTVEMVKEQETGGEIKEKLERKTIQSIDKNGIIGYLRERDETHRKAHTSSRTGQRS